jgi:hypothetical protein
VALSAAPYGCATVPSGKGDVLVMTSLAGATVMLNWAVTGVSAPLSFSLTVKVATPR